MTKQFKIGWEYSTRSICDHDCIITATILSRTDKTVRAKISNRDAKTFRIAERDGVEFIRPWGRYSMSPIIDATDC